MAKSHHSRKTLNRLFDRSSQPVYFVSPDYRIIYANDACAEWTGLEPDSIVSAACVFASLDLDTVDNEMKNGEVQNKIQGLCPPPEILNQDQSSESIPDSIAVWALNGENQKTWRQATMSRFFDADQDLLGVLIVCCPWESESLPLPFGTETQDAVVDPDRLHAVLAKIRTISDRTYSLECLIGTSPFANRLRRQVKTSIESNSDLLIVGPHGSGKEHLSRTIHAARDHHQQSELLPVHCSIADQRQIQQNIKDIVGSRASGNDSDEQDWLLLLDVDRLGEAAQNELFGFFQLPDFPLRTIATSSVSLIDLAGQQQYSEELAHYLSVMTIELVPLSKRKTDIPTLSQSLIERDNVRREKQFSGFSNEVMQQFIEFDWPENIDQLNRTIQAAARNASGSKIQVIDLPDEFRHSLQAKRIGASEETNIVLDQFLGKVEKELVSRALKQAKGNKTKAARLLGISRPKLLRRLQLFSLDDGGTQTDQLVDGQLDPSAFEEAD